MNTPYRTPTGIQIGLLYQPAMPVIQGDALRLQAALLNQRTPSRIERLVSRIWIWL